jgi:DNA repair photolyase
LIYEPKGKAREYSPLAVNLYKGCGHCCSYCYVPGVIKITRNDFDNQVDVKKDVKMRLTASALKYQGTDKQVLMSFTTDPYNDLNEFMKLTRIALQIFLDHKIPVAVLSKGGTKVLQDIDLFRKFGKHIKVGSSLTFLDDKDSRRWERNAALPFDRIGTLKTLNKLGIRTWVSLEPVIDPQQTLNLIDETYQFVDEYQVGKLNYTKSNIDWSAFIRDAYYKLINYKKEFYIKSDLSFTNPYIYGIAAEKYFDQDYLVLPPFLKENKNSELFNS